MGVVRFTQKVGTLSSVSDDGFREKLQILTLKRSFPDLMWS